MRMRTILPFLALLTLAFVPATARPADKPEKPEANAPALVIRVKPINDLLADVQFLAQEAGHVDQAKQMTGVFKAFGGKAFDASRPLGLYAIVGEDLSDVSAVALVPVASEQDILDLLSGFSMKPEKGEDGVYTLNVAHIPVPVYFRVQDHYAYVTARSKGALAKDKLLDASRALPAGDNELISATFHLDRLPDGVKDLGLQFLDQAAAQAKDKEEPGETETQRKLRGQLLDTLARRVGRLMKQGREVRLRVGVDRQGHEFTASFDVSGAPGSELAADIAGLGRASSLFASLPASNAAMNFLVHASLPEDLRKVLAPVIDEGMRKGAEREKDEARRAQAKKFLEVIEPTLTAGELDLAFSLRPAADQHFAIILAIKVKNGDQIDQAVHELVQGLPEKDRGKFKLDAESAGSTKIHQVDIHGEYDAEARRILGENPFYFAFRSDALVIVAGPDGLAAVREALETKAGIAPELRFDLSLARLTPLMTKDNPGAPEAARKAFGESAGDKDRVHFSIEGGDSLKVRFSMKTPVLQFLDLTNHGHGHHNKEALPRKERRQPKEDGDGDK